MKVTKIRQAPTDPVRFIQACKFVNIPSNGPWDNWQTNTFWLKFGRLSLAVTLKIRSRSPKSIQLFIMSKCYIHANLVKIRQLVHEIIGHTSTFWLKFGSLCPAVTLKNRSRPRKPNELFIMSQCYIHANWLKFTNQFMRYGSYKHFLA